MTRSTWLQSPRKALLLVLLDKDGYNTFYEFLKSEYATENLEFWTRLELIFTGATRREVLEIGSSLLEGFDEESINIRDSLRKEVVEVLGEMSKEYGLPSTPESIRSFKSGTQPRTTHTMVNGDPTRQFSIFDNNMHRPPAISNAELPCHSLPDGTYTAWAIPAMSRQSSSLSLNHSANSSSFTSELSSGFVQNMKESFFRTQRKSELSNQSLDGSGFNSNNVSGSGQKGGNTPRDNKGSGKNSSSSDTYTPRNRNRAMTSMKNMLFKTGSPRTRAFTHTSSARPSIGSRRSNSLTMGDCQSTKAEALSKRSSRSNSDLISIHQDFESTENSTPKRSRSNTLRAMHSTSDIKLDFKSIGQRFGASLRNSPITSRAAKSTISADQPPSKSKTSFSHDPLASSRAGSVATEGQIMEKILAGKSAAVDVPPKSTQSRQRNDSSVSTSTEKETEISPPKSIGVVLNESASRAPRDTHARHLGTPIQGPSRKGSNASTISQVPTPTWRDIAQKTIKSDSDAFSFGATPPEKEPLGSYTTAPGRGRKASLSCSSTSLKANRRTSEGDIVKSEDSLRKQQYSSPITEAADRGEYPVQKDGKQGAKWTAHDMDYRIPDLDPMSVVLGATDTKDMGPGTGMAIQRATSWRDLANIKKKKYYSFDSPIPDRPSTYTTHELQVPQEQLTASMLSTSIATGGGLGDKEAWLHTASDTPLFIGPLLCNNAEEGEHTDVSSGGSHTSLVGDKLDTDTDGCSETEGLSTSVTNAKKRLRKAKLRKRKLKEKLRQSRGGQSRGGQSRGGDGSSREASRRTSGVSQQACVEGVVGTAVVGSAPAPSEGMCVAGEVPVPYASLVSKVAEVAGESEVRPRQRSAAVLQKHVFTDYAGNKRHSLSCTTTPGDGGIRDGTHVSKEQRSPSTNTGTHYPTQCTSSDKHSAYMSPKNSTQKSISKSLSIDLNTHTLPHTKTNPRLHNSVHKTSSNTIHKHMTSSQSSDSVPRTEAICFADDQLRDIGSPEARQARVVHTENEIMDACRSAIAVYTRNTSHNNLHGTPHPNGALTSKRSGQMQPKRRTSTSSGSSGSYIAKNGGKPCTGIRESEDEGTVSGVNTGRTVSSHTQNTEPETTDGVADEAPTPRGTHAKRDRRGSRTRTSIGSEHHTEMAHEHRIPRLRAGSRSQPSQDGKHEKNSYIDEHALADVETTVCESAPNGVSTAKRGAWNNDIEAHVDLAGSAIARKASITSIGCKNCLGTGYKVAPDDVKDPLRSCSCFERKHTTHSDDTEKEALTDSEVQVLRSAQRQMLSLMALDSFQRFLNSAPGTDFVERMLKRPPRTLQPEVKRALDAYHATLGAINKETNQYISWLTTVISLADMLPFCVTMATRNSKSSEGPYPLSFVNFSFIATTRYSSKECLGRNCRFLQGPDTSVDNTSRCRTAIEGGQPYSTQFVNYKKDGERFKSKVQLIPVFAKERDRAPPFYLGLQYDTSTSSRGNADYIFESLTEYVRAHNKP